MYTQNFFDSLGCDLYFRTHPPQYHTCDFTTSPSRCGSCGVDLSAGAFGGYYYRAMQKKFCVASKTWRYVESFLPISRLVSTDL